MQGQEQRQKAAERKATAVGLALAAAVHVCAFALCSWSGLKYIWPPPEETAFVVEFDSEAEREEPAKADEAPAPPAKGEEISGSKSADAAPETDGDVEVPAAAEEAKPDPRALFPGMSKRDTAAAAPVGKPEAEVAPRSGNSAELSGRSVEGQMPKPRYNVQESGTVVVSIWVDNYGNVVKALAGADGTTVTSSALWAAARAAAMQTHFNMSADAPALQEGRITYIFNLK